MISTDSVQTVIGSTAYGTDGSKLGTVGQVYLDNATGAPEWVTVRTGLFGTKESFVPLAEAELTGDGLRLPYDSGRVKGAPSVDADRELSPEEESRLYEYYGLTSGYTGTTTGTTTGRADYATGLEAERGDTITGGTYATGQAVDPDDVTTPRGNYATGLESERNDTLTGGTYATGQAREDDTWTATSDRSGHDTTGPTTDDAMTRSEERVRTSTRQQEAGRARLRKYVTTETQHVEVPVTREQVRLEREPITDANRDAALDGPDLSEEEHEIVLTEERPVVNTETVPVERVRLGKEQVQDTEGVDVDVRSEQIETEGDVVEGRGRRA